MQTLTPETRGAALPGRAPQNTNNGATSNTGGVSPQEAIATLDALTGMAFKAAGVADEAAFRKLPRQEQNAFLAQARGQSRPEAQAAEKRSQYQLVAPSRIGRSPFNRSHFEQKALDDLTEDVRLRGVLQPLIVRKNPTYRVAVIIGQTTCQVVTYREDTVVAHHLGEKEAKKICSQLNAPEFELIAGERRWRASTAAALVEVPIILRVATDREAVEDQAVENLHREDLNPIDEAEKYQQLVEAYRRDGMGGTEAVEAVAAKLQRSKSLIYERLKLLKLPEATRAAALDGRLPSSHAALIATVDDEAAQLALTERILKPKAHQFADENEADFVPGIKIMAHREAKRETEKAQRELKAQREFATLKEKFRQKGDLILDAADAKKLFDKYGRFEGSKFYVRIVDTCPQDRQSRSWKDALGKFAPSPILVQDPEDGSGVILYTKSDAAAAAKKKGLKRESSSASAESSAERERKEKHKARLAEFDRIISEIVTAAEHCDSQDIWGLLVGERITSQSYRCETVMERRGIKGAPGDLAVAFANASGKELRGLLVELFFSSHRPSSPYYDNDWQQKIAAACRFFNVRGPAEEAKSTRVEKEEN